MYPVYNSLYCSPCDAVKLQIASLLATQKSEIPLKYVDVQMQSGTIECGMCAIALTTALSGKYISAMREQLTMCLETGVFSMLAMHRTRRICRLIKSTATIKMCCDCRMPMWSSSNMLQWH